jgi:hypothetical protein
MKHHPISILGFLLFVAPSFATADQASERFQQGVTAANDAWSRKDWSKVREVLRPIVEDQAAPPQQRSISHLRSARSLIEERAYDAALRELELIASQMAYPKVHRDEAVSLSAEVTRLKKGQPAFDPELSRVRVPKLPEPGRVIHVTPDGGSDADGSKARPFGSLEKALAAVAGMPKVTGGTQVLLASGRYPVAKSIRLSKELSGTAESPLVIRAVKPGSAVLYGGAVLKGFQAVKDTEILKRLPAEARDKLVQCDLKALGITDYGNLAVRGFGHPNPPPTLEFFANGKAQLLARWPNTGFTKAGKLIDPGDPNSNRPSVFNYVDDRHARWTTATDAWLSGYFNVLWAGSTLPVGKIDPEKKSLTTAQPYNFYNGGMDEKQGIIYFAYNLLEEIDQPGEWYLDRNHGILYWYPEAGTRTPTLELSQLAETMWIAEDMDHLRIDGLVFDCARYDAMRFKNCSDLLVAGCTVRRMADNAITIDGGFRNRIVGCDIHTLGRGGFRINGGDRPSLTPGNHVVANCRFHHFSRIDRTYTPAILLEGVGNRVAHCLFEECPSSAMRVEGNDHIIEFNEFRKVVLESDDQGAIDMWNNPTYRGVVFRYNLFEDIGDGSGQHAGQGSIRFDDVISGMTVYGNVFHRGGRGFGGVHMNCGRDNFIDNNLFIDCPVAVSGGYGNWNGSWQSAQSANPPPEYIMSELYRTRYPELNRMFEPPFVNYMWRNAIIRCGQDIKWSPEAYDRLANSITGDDSGFIEKGLLNRKASPETFEKIGLRPIPVAGIGLYDDPSRTGWGQGNSPQR